MDAADYILCRSHIDKEHIKNMGIDMHKFSVYRGAIDTEAIVYHESYLAAKILSFLAICTILQMRMHLA